MILHRVSCLQSLRGAATHKPGLAQLLPTGLETLLQPVDLCQNSASAPQHIGCLAVQRGLHNIPGDDVSFCSREATGSAPAAVTRLHAKRRLSTQAAANQMLKSARANPPSQQSPKSAGLHAVQELQTGGMQQQEQPADSDVSSASGDAGSVPKPADTWAAQPQPPAAAHSPATSADETTDHSSGGRVFVYHAPLSTTVRRLKMLSLAGCGASMMSAPIIAALNSGAGTGLGGRLAIGGVLAAFGMFTTGLLQWFVSPYVHTLCVDRATGELEATTLNMLARPVVSRFRVEDAQFADTARPQVTFQAKGRFYYLDGDHFGDKALFDRLNIPDPNKPPDETAPGSQEPPSAEGLDAERLTIERAGQSSSSVHPAKPV